MCAHSSNDQQTEMVLISVSLFSGHKVCLLATGRTKRIFSLNWLSILTPWPLRNCPVPPLMLWRFTGTRSQVRKNLQLEIQETCAGTMLKLSVCALVRVCVDEPLFLDNVNQGLLDVWSLYVPVVLTVLLCPPPILDSVRSSDKVPEEAVVDEEAILSLLENSQTFLPLSQTSNHSPLLGMLLNIYYIKNLFKTSIYVKPS